MGPQLPALRALAVVRPPGRDVLQPDGGPQAGVAQQLRRGVDQRGGPRQHAALRDRVLPAIDAQERRVRVGVRAGRALADVPLRRRHARRGVRRPHRDRGRGPRRAVRHLRRAARRLQVDRTSAATRSIADNSTDIYQTHIKTDETGLRVLLRWDTLDNPYFPRHGLRVNAEGFFGNRRDDLSREIQLYDDSSSRAGLYANAAYPARRRTDSSTSRCAPAASPRAHEKADPISDFNLGGFLQPLGPAHRPALRQLPGFRARRLLPPDRQHAAARPRRLSRRLAGGRQRVAATAATSRSRALRTAGSVFVAADTWLGPFYFAWGRASGGEISFYIYLGRL